MKRSLLALFLFVLGVSISLAANKKVPDIEIILNHIDTIKAEERLGDELYVDIEVLKPNQGRTYLRVPKEPKSWSSNHIKRVKQVPLWSADLASNESFIVLISLMEQDLNEMNPDDLIGMVRLEIKNQEGKLSTAWSIPNRTTGPTTIQGKDGEIKKFELYGGHGQYDLYLELKQNKK